MGRIEEGEEQADGHRLDARGGHLRQSRGQRGLVPVSYTHLDVYKRQVACVTVAKTMRVAEFGRRLDASIRRAGFAPLRLDLAQDAGFAAATLPLGLGLTRKADE